jgi:redox-sensitive bicupin YhaK (pirin superfamily)
MILERGKIEHALKTQNPFVIAMYHHDDFPVGNGHLGPVINPLEAAENSNTWRMYYGRYVPGFPAHPHRGFETVTVVVEGTVDHTDGMGSQGRYADGDVQWMTAGKGLQHAEMFPLRKTNARNPLELFQIWLSLDRQHRMVEPAYKMLWDEDIPKISLQDEAGKAVKVTLIAGEAHGAKAPEPTPDSWAHDPSHHLSIQLLELSPGAVYVLPAGEDPLSRSLYFYAGDTLTIEEEVFEGKSYAFVQGNIPTELRNLGTSAAKVLLLEADPIPEPIVAYGPFVMSSMEEIKEAYRDYQATQFGGWPFPETEVYYAVEQERFARHANGSLEYPPKE